ncbi:MAG: beta strand repeat-containing protein [Sphingomonas sp.]
MSEVDGAVIDDGATAQSARADFVPALEPYFFAPLGANALRTVAQNHSYVIAVSDFGFSDVDEGDQFLAVKIATLPGAGILTLDADGPGGNNPAGVTAGQFVSVADIAAGRLVYTPALDGVGEAYASFKFQVQDNGEGSNLDSLRKDFVFNVAPPTPLSFAPVITLASLGGNGFALRGWVGGNAGESVASAGDFNGDGIADFLVSVDQGTSSAFAPSSFVIFGKPGLLGPMNLASVTEADGVRITGVSNTKVAAAGDVNGDGYDDVILGIPDSNAGGTLSGLVHVVFGRASGASTISASALLTGSTGFSIIGDAAEDHAGISISAAGDVNGDGFSDIIIGAPGKMINGSAGKAYVIFGKASGFGTIDLSAPLPAAAGFKITGGSFANAGASVASADVNGDGYDDLIIGGPASSTTSSPGSVYVIYGKASGFNTINLGSLSGIGFSVNGAAAQDRTGTGVASAGDVNGDGIDDILIGATGSDAGGTNAGAVYLVFGGASGMPNNLATMTASQGFRITGTGDTLGASMASAGDVNGDGYADIIVGAALVNANGVDSGAAWVIFGKASGFANIDLATLTAAQGFKISGPGGVANGGASVASAGDANGDGYDDMLVGASGTSAGGAYLIYGRPNPNLAPTGTDATQTILEDQAHVFTAANFGFADAQGHGLLGVTIAILPGAGSLTYDADGAGGAAAVAVTAGQTISAVAIAAGKLVYRPGANGNGIGYDSFTFRVQDNGGALHGGVDTDVMPRTMTFNVTPQEDAATAGADTAQTAENAVRTIAVLANDVDVDGPAPAIAQVAGSVLVAGGSVVLPSGARVTLNADGTLSYDPDGVFNWLVPANVAAATGAVGQAIDSFDYTLVGGAVATVQVTVTGVASAGDQLRGTAGADTIAGTNGADVIDGLGGADRMAGGLGDDSYIVSQLGDLAVELNAQGNDTVFSSITYALTGQYIENLILTGSAAIDATGNKFDNILTGNSGANTLTGGDGNDTLDGGGGIDTMIGGLGDDTYFIDQLGDVAQESGSSGYDRVFSSISYGLAGQYIEALTLTGNAAINATGNSLANVLTGNGAANTLTGLEGNDVLDGGGGIDTMLGGVGDDTYTVDQAGDVAVELNGQGTDSVFSSVSYSLAGQFVENLTLTGSAAIDATGNKLDNLLTGNSAANILTGGEGNDTLNGGGGADTMIGGLGDDIYYVDQVGDVAQESANNGYDTVFASISYALSGQYIEALTLTGTGAINATGNSLANILIGNNGANALSGLDGDDALHGGLGADTLTGGNGADGFWFDTALDGGVDNITDFSVAADTIYLDHSIFTGLANGVLNPDAFHAGSAAHDADDRILYDAATGNIYYDADGDGAGAAVLFAHVTAGAALTNADFVLV